MCFTLLDDMLKLSRLEKKKVVSEGGTTTTMGKVSNLREVEVLSETSQKADLYN